MSRTQPLWQPAPRNAALGDDEVHIYRVSLSQPEAVVERLLAVMAPDEVGRAERFHFRKHRDYFIAGRGQLRHLLSRYTGQPPERLRFTYTEYGKPSLAEESNLNDLYFNVSHSNDLALFAVTRRRQIGVDCEYMKEDVELEQIAARFFSPVESALLASLPEEQRRRAFFTCWSRKEAYIKARGEGLSLPLSQFDVSFAYGDGPALLANRNDPEELNRWAIYEVQPAANYAGALVVEGKRHSLRLWDLNF